MLALRIELAGYGTHPVLHDISIDVPSGSIVSLLGPNGAGKTTAVRALSGLIRFSGSVTLDGRQLAGMAPENIARQGILQVPEGRGTLAPLSVVENLMVGAYLRTDGDAIRRDLEWVYAMFPRLQERQKQQAGSLSGGEQQMLAVSRALMGNPRYLILDEPSFGLAPMVIEQIFTILEQVRKVRGMGILLVEQNAKLALSISDHGYVLEAGTIRLSGSGQTLAQNPDVVAAYLGN